MGKKAEQNKISSGANGISVEHNAVYDDNLLPATDELAKLHAIDPDIVNWIKDRTIIEQDARIDFNNKRIAIASREVNLSAILTGGALLLYILVISAFFYLSYNLIIKGYTVAGTVFGSADLCGFLLILFKIRNRKSA
ncbi:MAG: hypothetical protein NC226_09500 [Bacteroides cellulosilyticus]|nr:hypothetical protein [Bacteroides cellulosilyticus]